jgi:hypothetical protein
MAAFARDGLAKKDGNKLLDEKPVQTGKYTGREVRVAIGRLDDVSISRAFAVTNRYYSLTAIVSKKNADSPEVAKFFDSFQVNE